MSNFLRGVVTTVIIAVVAGVTNPSPERHREKIRAAIGERSPLAGALGVGALTAFTSNYHSLGVASYTESGDKLLSWGAFGYVCVRQ